MKFLADLFAALEIDATAEAKAGHYMELGTPKIRREAPCCETPNIRANRSVLQRGRTPAVLPDYRKDTLQTLLRFKHLQERGIVNNRVTLCRWKSLYGFPPGRMIGANTRVLDGGRDRRMARVSSDRTHPQSTQRAGHCIEPTPAKRGPGRPRKVSAPQESTTDVDRPRSVGRRGRSNVVWCLVAPES